MLEAKPSEKTYLGVQALRALAALLVVIFHAGGDWVARVAANPAYPNPPWPNGQAGVDIFFVISGFVMGVTAPGLQKFQNRAWVFLSRRFVRIVPLYWIITTLKIVRMRASSSGDHDALGGWWQIVASYLFIPSPHTRETPIPLLTVGWTLNFEVMFYGLFAIALAWELPLLWFLLPTLGSLATVGWFERNSAALSGSPVSTLVLEFLFGVVVAHCTLRQRLPGRRGGWLLFVVGWLALLALPEFALGDRAFSWGLPAAAIVSGSVALEDVLGKKWPRWLLELGNASYAIYLSHNFILSSIWGVLLRVHLRGLSSLALMLALALSLSAGVGELVHRLVEVPVLRVLRGRQVRGVTTLPPGPA